MEPRRIGVAGAQPRLHCLARIGLACLAAAALTNASSARALFGRRPADSLAAHLTFAFKHEGVHLEFLARLFDVLPAVDLQAWIAAEPTGQYARRAGFFYEYLTGRPLTFSGVTAGNYVDALSPDAYLVASQSVNNPRWRVRRQLGGEYLSLLQFFLNHRTFLRSRVPERVGKSPK
jgi:hypothetical protein